jgi:hypothetical protein
MNSEIILEKSLTLEERNVAQDLVRRALLLLQLTVDLKDLVHRVVQAQEAEAGLAQHLTQKGLRNHHQSRLLSTSYILYRLKRFLFMRYVFI